MDADDLRELFESFCSFGSSRNLASPHASMESVTGPLMDGPKFAKFARDNHVLGPRMTSTDVDIIFNRAKTKGHRKLDYNMFQEALQMIADKKYPSKKGHPAFDQLMREMNRKGTGPVVTGTVPQSDAVLERLTDTHAYTGMHKLRFDDEGHGLGMAGRDQPSKTNELSKLTNREETSLRGLPISADPSGSTGKRAHASVVTGSEEKLDLASSKPKKADARSSNTNLAGGQRTSVGVAARRSNTNLAAGSSSRTTSNTNLASNKKSTSDLASGRKAPITPASKGGYTANAPKASVFDRLTSTSGYTGTHKERFNADGSGRGLAGRDAPVKGGDVGTYRGGDVKDLKQILRS